ncbi:hypothetical protein AVEN_28067-1 [Araneus ventricosus]|uniref:Uncharacterized protein n=1 Tax=Araneus ventricosus TaxID=182803 RepID=A0A4Y2R4X5_ARAVE|nr:hypothetical protein AVEN_28067-1 [Araneus ventricosus]
MLSKGVEIKTSLPISVITMACICLYWVAVIFNRVPICTVSVYRGYVISSTGTPTIILEAARKVPHNQFYDLERALQECSAPYWHYRIEGYSL